jgi:hypothetical protein
VPPCEWSPSARHGTRHAIEQAWIGYWARVANRLSVASCSHQSPRADAGCPQMRITPAVLPTTCGDRGVELPCRCRPVFLVEGNDMGLRRSPQHLCANQSWALARAAPPARLFWRDRATSRVRGRIHRACGAAAWSAALSTHRILHCGTHGALAGQVSGDAEPGLLLTRPIRQEKSTSGTRHNYLDGERWRSKTLSVTLSMIGRLNAIA